MLRISQKDREAYEMQKPKNTLNGRENDNDQFKLDKQQCPSLLHMRYAIEAQIIDIFPCIKQLIPCFSDIQYITFSPAELSISLIGSVFSLVTLFELM